MRRPGDLIEEENGEERSFLARMTSEQESRKRGAELSHATDLG